jgi:NodT family efflux transporter outer membrane factor (OMF) lipoprotein
MTILEVEPAGKLRTALVLGVFIALLGGCQTAAGPEYDRPDVGITTAGWSQLEGRELRASEVIRPDWWGEFGDGYLNALIDEAIDDSVDMRVKAVRLETAGIRVGEARRDRFPDLKANVQRSHTSTSESGNSFAETADVNLSWEVDVWGKIKKQAQATDAAYLATEMEWRAMHLTLVTSVAERYFGIRQYDEQITQQELAVEQAEHLLKIYRAQYGEGIVPKTKVLNQEARISTLVRELMELQRSRKESELKLATLIGRQAGHLEVPVAPLLSTVELLHVPSVLPADMLASRPDVLEAEYRLLEAHHLVGKARLARLPSFNLNATTSILTGTWSVNFIENFSSMLDRDTKIDVELSELQLEGLVETYRKAVLNAFEEVEVSLLNLDVRQQQMEELNKQIAALKVVNDVQIRRLQEGLVSQLEVFQTEQDLLGARQLVLSVYQLMLTDTLNLYKALGGGWPAERVREDSVAVRQADR